MKLLVTGGAGYVGSVCAAHLVDAGHEVAVLDDLSTGHRDAVPTEARFIEADLAHRDFAANAIAIPLGGGEPIDPQAGIADIEEKRLRVLDGAYAADPLRPFRLARLATELGFSPDARTEKLTLEASAVS